MKETTKPSIEEAKIHNLKTWPEYFKEVVRGRKLFEIRKNDRNFQKGDILNLQEYEPKKNRYTGVSACFRVIYILSGGQFGVETDNVVMGITPINRAKWMQEQQEPTPTLPTDEAMKITITCNTFEPSELPSQQIIQSSFHFKNGIRFTVFTGQGKVCSFKCDENWKPIAPPVGECPLDWSKKSDVEYHLHLRNEVHPKEDFVPEHSTSLEPTPKEEQQPQVGECLKEAASKEICRMLNTVWLSEEEEGKFSDKELIEKEPDIWAIGMDAAIFGAKYIREQHQAKVQSIIDKLDLRRNTHAYISVDYLKANFEELKEEIDKALKEPL